MEAFMVAAIADARRSACHAGAFTQPATLQLADLEGPFSIDWQEQRADFAAKPAP
jgi:hypothetical protein